MNQPVCECICQIIRAAENENVFGHICPSNTNNETLLSVGVFPLGVLVINNDPIRFKMDRRGSGQISWIRRLVSQKRAGHKTLSSLRWPSRIKCHVNKEIDTLSIPLPWKWFAWNEQPTPKQAISGICWQFNVLNVAQINNFLMHHASYFRRICVWKHENNCKLRQKLRFLALTRQ